MKRVESDSFGTILDGPLLIFSDFDGTIARADVGYHTLSRFSRTGNDDLVALWKARLIGARECLREEVSRVSATREEMLNYVDDFTLDPHFLAFRKQALERGHTIITLSDGLDFYIRHLLEKHGIVDMEVHANEAVFSDEGLQVRFLHAAPCGRCGSCKKDRIGEIVAREKFAGQIVFVGDGYSDLCALEAADIIFAKRDLRAYCESEGISYHPFETFLDVENVLFYRTAEVSALSAANKEQS